MNIIYHSDEFKKSDFVVDLISYGNFTKMQGTKTSIIGMKLIELLYSHH